MIPKSQDHGVERFPAKGSGDHDVGVNDDFSHESPAGPGREL
jgi:hypothetical protein